MADTLKGKKIRISCTLNDKKGALIALPGATLTIGDDLDEATAKQLLAGGSAVLLGIRTPTDSE
jgi:hypothetical protein